MFDLVPYGTWPEEIFDVFSKTYCYNKRVLTFYFRLCVLQSSINFSLLSDICLNRAIISFFDWDTKPNGLVTHPRHRCSFCVWLLLNLLESPIFCRLVCYIVVNVCYFLKCLWFLMYIDAMRYGISIFLIYFHYFCWTFSNWK